MKTLLSIICRTRTSFVLPSGRVLRSILDLSHHSLPLRHPSRWSSTLNNSHKDKGVRFDFYPYEALPPGPSFRLLVLYPTTHRLSQNGDRVVVSLRSSPLDATTLAYEALSYNWNDPYAMSLLPSSIQQVPNEDGNVSCAISIDGQYTIPATPNLILALRALRLENTTRVLWVDALCIDQSNPQEKSSQIPLMTDIYSRATKVIIWVGEEDRWTSGSASVIRRWAKIYTEAQKTGARQPEILASLKQWRTFEVEEQQCFEALIRRAWFTRAWTFQELCLAAHAEIRCGTYAIPWAMFRDACAAVIAAGQENLVFEEHENVKTLFDFYNLCQQMPEMSARAEDERFQLSRLLQRTRPQQSTDPRDKLYSLLGIANRARRSKQAYRIDYNEPARDVYCRFAYDMIVEDGDLGILSMVQRKQSQTKEVEYHMRWRAWQRIQKQMEEDEAQSENAPSPNQVHCEVGDENMVMWRQAFGDAIPELFQRPGLADTEAIVQDLPSWVPDFANQDHVEYVAIDSNIRNELPETLIRTRFPKPIAQQFNEGWPRYWLNRQFSYRIESGNITYTTGNPDQLGLWGAKIGTIKRVYEMPFTSDPTVRASETHSSLSNEADAHGDAVASEYQAPSAPKPFNFDFTDRLWPAEGAESVEDEPTLTEDLYKHTNEGTRLAMLRTLTADMLPISPRLPEAHKIVHFPFHYDWHFWNHGPLDRRRRKFPNLIPSQPSRYQLMTVDTSSSSVPMPIEIGRLLLDTFRLARARLTLWMRGGSSTSPWTEFDGGELRHGRRIKEMYAGFLVAPRDILFVASLLQTWSAFAGSTFRSALPFLILEGVLKDYWKHTLTPGTFLEGVPTAWVWLFVWSVVYYLVIRPGARRARSFERDASIPVGWSNGAARVAEIARLAKEAEERPYETLFKFQDVQGLWGISCEIQNAVNRASWNREFLVTENGYMGIGPVGMRPGDEVWNLIGGHVPFVLRPCGKEASDAGVRQYQLVGESYVHGVMDGELWAEDRDTWNDLEKMKSKATKLILV